MGLCHATSTDLRWARNRLDRARNEVARTRRQTTSAGRLFLGVAHAGLGHLFDLIITARLSPNRNDFALIAMLGLLGLRIFEACGADLAEEYSHRVLRLWGKGGRVVLVPLPPAVAREGHRAQWARL